MRKISANYIFPCSHKPIKNGIVILSAESKITDIIDPGDKYREMANVEFYNGVITPGFVITKDHIKNGYKIPSMPTEITKQNYFHYYNQGIRLMETVPDEMVQLDMISLMADLMNDMVIDFNKAIDLMTLNAARELHVDDHFGSLSINKTPGINLISPFDFNNFRPNHSSKLKRLL